MDLLLESIPKLEVGSQRGTEVEIWNDLDDDEEEEEMMMKKKTHDEEYKMMLLLLLLLLLAAWFLWGEIACWNDPQTISPSSRCCLMEQASNKGARHHLLAYLAISRVCPHPKHAGRFPLKDVFFLKFPKAAVTLRNWFDIGFFLIKSLCKGSKRAGNWLVNFYDFFISIIICPIMNAKNALGV